MSLRIPLRLPAATGIAAAPRTGVRIPLPVRIPGFSRETDPDMQVVRAVAGAAGICNPAEAAKLAEAVAKSPAVGLDPRIDREALASVLDAVDAVRRDPKTAPAIHDVHRAVAQAVGADPALVAAAYASVSQDRNRCETARSWVGAIQADLLSTAARSAVRRTLLQLVPKRTEDRALPQIAELEGRVAELGSRVEKLEKADAQT